MKAHRCTSWSYLKTSFSRYHPVMHGQATSIQHFHQRGKTQTTKTPWTNNPSYLQSLHCFRPTKPSHNFTRTGLGRIKPQGLKTPGRFQTYLLFTMYPKQAPSPEEDANFSSKDNSQPHNQFPKQRSNASPSRRVRSEGPLTREHK